jgi:hypothetical protein
MGYSVIVNSICLLSYAIMSGIYSNTNISAAMKIFQNVINNLLTLSKGYLQ